MKAALLVSLLITQHGTIQTGHDNVPIYGHHGPVATFDPSQADEIVSVPAGQTVTVNGAESCKYLIVGGTVRVHGTLNAHTVTVLPGGSYEQTGTLVIRAGPFEDHDPGQFGRGLLVFGRAHLAGPRVDQSAALARPVSAGDRVLHLAQSASGWRAGDELVLPETFYRPRALSMTDERVTPDPQMGAMLEECRIKAVHGPVVVLEQPAAHDHKQFRVFNTSRRCRVVSEDANQRGHVIAFPGADIDFRNVEFLNVGRTTEAPISPTNQIGRYGIHLHHGIEGAVIRGCSVVRPNRWGIAVHDSHRNTISENLVYAATGAAFVTEQGNEYQNVFEDNVALWCKGSGGWIEDRSNVHARGSGDQLWHLGSGFGLNSGANILRGNTAVNCQMGFGVAGHGGHLDLTQADGSNLRWQIKNRGAYPFGGWEDNTAYYCTTGMEIWNAPSSDAIPFKRFMAVGCNQGTNIVDTADPTMLRQCQFIGCNYCVVFRPGYEFEITVDHCYMEGVYGYRMVDTAGDLLIRDCVMYCETACIDVPAGMLARVPRTVRVQDSTLDAPRLVRVTNQRGTGVGTVLVLNGRTEKYINTFPVRWEWTNVNGENLNLYLAHQTPDFTLPGNNQYQDLVRQRNGDMYDEFGVCVLGYMAPEDAAPHPRMQSMLAAPYVETIPPRVSGVQTSRDGGNIRVQFTTDRPCRGTVRYLGPGGRWKFAPQTALGTAHDLTVPDATDNSVWIYARDAAGVPAHEGRKFLVQ